jgi:hypothetical protein
VALAPVALLGALWAGGRAEQALAPAVIAASSAPPGPTLPAAARLSEPEVEAASGFAGPDRPEEAPVPALQESRTWFAAGRWWSVLNRATDGALTIWGLSSATGPWVDTGILVDDRPFARPVVAWNGSVLVVATSGTRTYASHVLRTNRFSWDAEAATWSQLPDFPVTVTADPAPDVHLLLAPDGREWLARLDGQRIVVARSSASGLRHTAFAPLPGGIAGADVGGFDLVGTGPTVQLVWRSVSSDELRTATTTAAEVGTGTGTDASWATDSRTAYGIAGIGPVSAARTGGEPDAALVVLVPTTLAPRSHNDRDPALLVVEITIEHTRISMVSRVQDGLAGAALVLDPGRSQVQVLATHPPPAVPTGAAGAARPTPVVLKTASLDDLAFAPGPGRAVLYGDVGTRLAPPVVPAGPADAAQGLLVMAAGRDLSGWRTTVVGGQVATSPLAERTEPIDVVHDTFDGLGSHAATPAAWHAGTSQPLTSTIVAADGTGQALLVTNPDGGTAPLACRSIPASSGPVSVRADIVTAGTGATDARLLTLRGPDGSLASARLSRKGEAGWSGPDGRVVAGSVAHGTPLRVTITVDPKERTASIRIETGSGVVAESAAVPLLAAGTAGVDEVCLGPGARDPDASIQLTDLLVREG